MYDLFTGSISVLPTVLYLITGVLREMSSKSAERKSPVVVNSCLCTLKLLCTSQFLSDDSVSVRWSQSLQSALKTVLNSAKQSEYLMLIVQKKLNIFFTLLSASVSNLSQSCVEQVIFHSVYIE
jgi:hypothetical protein